jgi:serine/threonine-protein kinase BUR1
MDLFVTDVQSKTSSKNLYNDPIHKINKLNKSNKSNKSNLITPMSKLSDYDLYNQLGQGTFGVVTKARQKNSNKLVAIKKFIITDKKEGFPITAFREITIMKKLKNLNILQIIDIIYESNNNNSFFYTVSPYISSDLNGLLNNPRINLSLSQIKSLMLQILNGINYIHQSGYLHRDIKTANILLDHFGIVKIADFGLARLFHGDVPKFSNSPPGGGKFEYTGLVVTRWYRPPELLLGDRKYTTAVDIWGIGCVFGELFIKKPIFEGKSDIHQAEIIFKLLGSPTPENFPNAHLINRNNINLKINYSRNLELKFNSFMSNDALNLFSGMLTLDPMKRFNAVKCLESDFFKLDPLPCDSISLSNLEESHESDVKRFKEEIKSSQQLIPQQQQLQQQQQPISINKFNNNNDNNNSLNHSKYGAEISTYMNRAESTVNMPISAYPEKPQSNIPSHALSQSLKSTIGSKQIINNNIKNEKEFDNYNYDYSYDYDNYDSYNNYDNYNYNYNKDSNHLRHNSNQFKSKLPRQQLNQIQRHLQHENYHERNSKRGYANINDTEYSYPDTYGYQGADDNNYEIYNNDEENFYYYEKFNTNKRFKPLKNYQQSTPVKENLFSSQARGKDLYGSGSTGDTAGLSALTKVLMKKKQKDHDTLPNETSEEKSNQSSSAQKSLKKESNDNAK